MCFIIYQTNVAKMVQEYLTGSQTKTASVTVSTCFTVTVHSNLQFDMKVMSSDKIKFSHDRNVLLARRFKARSHDAISCTELLSSSLIRKSSR